MTRPQVHGWLFLTPESVPERWRGRGMDCVLVPLLPHETERMLADSPVSPELDSKDEELLRLVAAGLSAPAIARQLEVSVRSVTRRLASVRRRLGLQTTPELVSYLARRGF